MDNSVVIKGNKHGISVILDKDISFSDLKDILRDKFTKSAKFFGNSNMALSFEGRKLSADEESQLLDIISDSSDVNIVCIIDNDANTDKIFEDALKKAFSEIPAPVSTSDGQFYKGTLRSGQVLEAESSVIVLGDVNPGGRIIAKGNVIVLGSLKGNAFAGANGNEDAFVVALEMNPMQIKIGDVIARCSDNITKSKDKKKNILPKIAFVEDGNIYIENLDADILEDIRVN